MGLLVTSLQGSAPSSPASGFSVLYPLTGTERWYFKTAAGAVKTLLTMEDSLGSITATNVTLETGGALRTSTLAGNTALLQAYNTGGASYTTFGTLLAGATPSFTLDGATLTHNVVSTYLDFTAQGSNPPAPAAGTLRFHSATTQGFTRFEQDNEAPTNLILGRDNVFIAKNTTLSTITAGQVVYVTGSTGNVPNIGLAKADSLTTLPAVGIALDSINANAFGQVMKLGVVSNTNTAAFTTGDMLWVDATTAGALTKTRPAYPNYAQRIGSCLVSGVGNGSLLITVAPFIGGQETGTTQDFTHGGNAVFAAGKALQTSTSAGNTLLLQAYDTDTGPAYVTFGTLTAGTTPSFKLSNITMEGTWLASGTVTMPALTLGAAITYGGVTLTNAVTGTGKMVLDTSPTIATPVINSAAHVGGTWVADATWTLPALTLGGAVTGNGQNISGLGTVGAALGTFTAVALPAKFIATGTSLFTEYYKGTSTLVGYVGNGTGLVTAGGEANFGMRSEADLIFAAGGNNKVVQISTTAFTLGTGITSISGGTNPSLNIGTGSLTAGAGSFTADNVVLAVAATTATSRVYATWNNSGLHRAVIGKESSTGNSVLTGGTAYAFSIGTIDADAVHIGTGGSVRATFDANGINGALGGTTPAAVSATTGTFSSTLTLSGTAANIALGSNYISNGGADEGISVGASGAVTVSGTSTLTGNVGIGGAASAAKNLTLVGTATTTNDGYGLLINSTINTSAAGTNTLWGIRVAPSFGGAGSPAAQVGIDVDAITQISTAAVYGLRLQNASGTGKYNIYASGTAANYLAGNTLIGTSAARTNFPGTVTPRLQIDGTDGSSGSLGVVRNSNDTNPGFLRVGKSRGTTVGSVTVVQSGDSLGGIDIFGADGTNLIPAARIIGECDGTPGANDMPGRLVFSTTADGAATSTERMRIDSSGNVAIASTAKHYFDGVTATGDTYIVESSANVLDLYAGGANTLRLAATYGTVTGNLGIGTAAFGTNAVSVLAVFTGTAPATGPADSVQFYSSDNSAGNTIPSFFCEGTEVIATGQADSASSVRVKMRVNGTVVTFLAI